MSDRASDGERYFETTIEVRFPEVDSYLVVWHGHYVGWFEIGRNALAEAFGAGTKALQEAGYLLPVIALSIKYKRPAELGDRVTIRTRMREPRAAMFVCDYQAVRERDGLLLAEAESKQVVLNRDRELLVTLPRLLREVAARVREFHRGA